MVFILLFNIQTSNILTFNIQTSCTFKTKIIFMSFLYVVFFNILPDLTVSNFSGNHHTARSIYTSLSIWDPIMQKT